jgi:hypothetical protein
MVLNRIIIVDQIHKLLQLIWAIVMIYQMRLKSNYHHQHHHLQQIVRMFYHPIQQLIIRIEHVHQSRDRFKLIVVRKHPIITTRKPKQHHQHPFKSLLKIWVQPLPLNNLFRMRIIYLMMSVINH